MVVNDREGYKDPNVDPTHPAFINEEMHLRIK